MPSKLYHPETIPHPLQPYDLLRSPCSVPVGDFFLSFQDSSDRELASKLTHNNLSLLFRVQRLDILLGGDTTQEIIQLLSIVARIWRYRSRSCTVRVFRAHEADTGVSGTREIGRDRNFYYNNAGYVGFDRYLDFEDFLRNLRDDWLWEVASNEAVTAVVVKLYADTVKVSLIEVEGELQQCVLLSKFLALEYSFLSQRRHLLRTPVAGFEELSPARTEVAEIPEVTTGVREGDNMVDFFRDYEDEIREGSIRLLRSELGSSPDVEFNLFCTSITTGSDNEWLATVCKPEVDAVHFTQSAHGDLRVATIIFNIPQEAAEPLAEALAQPTSFKVLGPGYEFQSRTWEEHACEEREL